MSAKKIHVNIYVREDNYRKFQEYAKSLGVSASLLIDVMMFFAWKYGDKWSEILNLAFDDIGKMVSDAKEFIQGEVKVKKV